MDSTVKSRPNHYEVLGLTPAATADEIAQAFASQLDPLRPRPFGSLAEVTVAFETLRDRNKREAYDLALGLKPRAPSPPPAAPPEWPSYSMRASPRPAARPAADPLPPPAPKAEARPRPEPELPPFVLASRPEPTEPKARKDDPKPTPAAEEVRPPEPAPKPPADPMVEEGRLHFAESTRFQLGDRLPVQWKLPALAAGALVLAVGIGAWSGFEAGNDNEQLQSEQAATLKIPPAKPLPAAITALPDASVPSAAETQPERRTRAPAATAQVASNRQPLQIILPEEQPLEAVQSGHVATEQAAAETVPVAAAAAKMPLPNSVIASTIGRIGYPCGQVASTAAMDGAARGVFKVTCTSGHSYRAAPVNGRYRFRRLGSR